MKRWLLLAGIVALGVAAIVLSERQKVDAPASPAALLYLVADAEQELTRMPVSFTRMTDSEEIQIGDGLARLYLSGEERKNPDDRAVDQYLTRVGLSLAVRAHRKLPYKFHYLSDPHLINAFALPGGHIFVGEGLLALMDSEDELAAVIGHEIEHVDHYHCAERAQREQALRKLPLGGLVALPIEVFEAGYSKDQEMEADREGTRLAAEVGYSANGAIRLFETFDRLYKIYQSPASQPRTPQDEALRVAVQAMEGYFRSHPLPEERIAQIRTLIATQGWTARPERDLAVAYIFWTARAARSLAVHKYSEAEQLAKRSLKLKPGQGNALQVLARAEFSQAEFAAAAEAYRGYLESDTLDLEAVNEYALTLAAANRHTALAEFRQWSSTFKGEPPREITVAEAGLALLEGEAEPARKMEAEFQHPSDTTAVNWIEQTGWWRYLAGDYPRAVELLAQADQLHPGHRALREKLAWAQIEIRHYGDALASVDMSLRSGEPLPTAVPAVVHWRTQEKDEALREFESVLAEQPEWANVNLVKGLYAPTVAQNVEEILAERERRAKERAAAQHPR